MNRLSIRARLTLAFAAALLVVLVLAAAFVYLRVSDSLTDSLDDRLETQLTEVVLAAPPAAAAERPLPGPGDREDGFSQILAPDGDVIASSAGPNAGAVLDHAQLEEAALAPIPAFEKPIEGVDGDARILAGPVRTGQGEVIAVAAVSTDDREETLAEIAGAFAIGAPLAVLLASALGYLLAARALAPVESIRRRAGEITLERSGERLPLPAADDELRRLGETLNSMLDRIESSLDREREFVSDASHELRTPLAVLRAELELAERPGRSPEEMRAALVSAAEETDRLSRLAEDLLVLARSEQGRLPVKRERAPVGPLLERVRERFTARAAAEGRELSVDSADGLVADVDPLRVEQAIGNLVDNALVHGDGEVTLAGRRDGHVVSLSVSDEGAGFPGGFEARAFERFTRADEGRTGGGAGLGLAIVRTVARAHGGDAVAESSGDGTRVVVTITG